MAGPGSSQKSSHAYPLDDIDETILSKLRESDQPVGAAELLEHLERVDRRVSNATLARRLERLISSRHISRSGQARATRYTLDSYHDYFAVPPHRRPKVGYNAAALAGYDPNQTTWIDPDERSKLQDAGGGRRDASTYSNAIAQKLLVDLAYASSALEGNTYTYLDTQVLIEFGTEAEGKDRDETVMILNHKEAINYLTGHIADIEVSPREIKNFHALLSRGLSNMDPRDVGAVRRMPVDHIGGSAYLPLALPQLLEQELETIARKAIAIDDPFEQSLFLMVFVSYLQAFRDVNKRTARLVCNIPLLKAGLAPLSFMEMDGTAYVRGLLAFYELNRIDLIRDAYVHAYVNSAARYNAYMGRPKAVLDIEFRRRADIFGAVRDYVVARIDGDYSATAEEFAMERFVQDNEETRRMLADRVNEIVEALTEGNHIAYGITRDQFAAYETALTNVARPL